MTRLVLFDIDGTLLSGGPAKGAFEKALRQVFGTAGPIEGHPFAGKTDPQIARELLRLAGFGDGEIEAGLPAVWEVYLSELETRLSTWPMTVLPGVPEVLDRLAQEGMALGLLTGNIFSGARLKLTSAKLWHYFPVGAFGSDHEAREKLTPVALERARRYWGVAFSPRDAVVVGDTPRDVACGRWGGTRTVGVATGHHTPRELVEAGADEVLEDMADVGAALAAILGD